MYKFIAFRFLFHSRNFVLVENEGWKQPCDEKDL